DRRQREAVLDHSLYVEGKRLRRLGNDGVKGVSDGDAAEEVRKRRAEHSILLMNQRNHLHLLLQTSPVPSGLAIDRPQRAGWNFAGAAIHGDASGVCRMPILHVIAGPFPDNGPTVAAEPSLDLPGR